MRTPFPRPTVVPALIVFAAALVACQGKNALTKSTESPTDRDTDSTLHLVSPYAGVDWDATQRHRSNFHTHTTLSDGHQPPEHVIDLYHELGYTVLALTDHDTLGPAATTWPWSTFGRDAAELGMLAIEGNEISKLHHTGSYFNSFGEPDLVSDEQALREIGERGGLAVFFHPGRYKDKTIEWYADLYRRHDHLVGFEIYNQTDRYPIDRARWDELLTVLMPDRPVWGFSNDDMHVPENHLGFSWNVMLVTRLDEPAVRQAMETGRFYYVHDPDGPGGAAPPTLDRVTLDPDSTTITLETTGTDRIDWISRGKIIHQGNHIDLTQFPDAQRYIRAELHGPDQTIAGTQPFAIHRQLRP